MPKQNDPNNLIPKFTRNLLLDIRGIHISAYEKAFADLLSLGWNEKDAYIASSNYKPIYTEEANWRDMHQLTTENQYFINYVSRKKAMLDKRIERTRKLDAKEEERKKEIDLKEKLSKDGQLKELYASLELVEPGSSGWVAIRKMIADITQAKKDESKTEEKTIIRYAPINCRDCMLYIEKEQQEKQRRMREAEKNNLNDIENEEG